MSKISINILFGITLVVATVPALFAGRFLGDLFFTIYATMISGRFPLYDAIWSTATGIVVKNVISEGIVIYIGLLVIAIVSLLPFRTRRMEIYFGAFWTIHFII